MANFLQLKTEIANKIGEASLNAVIGDTINSIISYYQKTHFWFNESSALITLTVNDPVVPNIPSDFQYELQDGGVILLDNNIRYRLKKVGNAEYDANNIGGSGRPYIYRNRNNQLELYFYPINAYSLILFYVKSYSALSGDGDENDFTNNADRLIVNRALAELYETYKRDREQGQYFRSIADDEFRNLMDQTNDRTATGRLSINDIAQTRPMLGFDVNVYSGR